MRLLLIEDDSELALLLVRYLGRSGVEVTHVSDGTVGVDAFLAASRTANPFEVVLTDGLVPGKNGFQVAQAIRASPAGSKVGLALFSAAFRGARAQADAAQAGFDAYFAKPFVLTDLRDGLLKLGARSGAASLAPEPKHAPSVSTAPQQFTEPGRKPGLVVPPVTVVSGLASTAQALLSASRARFDGVIELHAEAASVLVAFLGGVVVGVTDTVPEHALGTWLKNQGRLSEAQAKALDARLTSTNERVAEALLALGFVTGPEALAMMESQAKSRLRRALLVQGEARATPGIDGARQIAVGAIDLVEQVLTAAMDQMHRVAAAAFVEAHGSDVAERTVDFDSGLVAFARVRPQSLLPPTLMAASSSVKSLGTPDPLEIHAMWVAGLVHVGAGQRAKLSLPKALTSQGGGRVVNTATVDRVVALLLRARGSHLYRLVDLLPNAATAEMLRRLTALNAEVGRDALKNEALGPAMPAARELWTILEEGIFVFSNERRRHSYDEDLLG